MKALIPSILKRPPWRTVIPLGLLLCLLGMAYLLWSPGKRVRNGRHDRGMNALWIQHGWIGDDGWFHLNGGNPTHFRDEVNISRLAALLIDHGIRYVYPHLCPCSPDGNIAPVDPEQVERFLDQIGGVEVVPWVGGVLDEHCFPGLPLWRTNFVASVVRLLESHPRLAGVQINIEPMPDGNPDFLFLLEELRRAMPEGKLLSVAAYPPPTRWHPYPDVHWSESYYREVARRVDQLVPMMYDTAIRVPKFYVKLMADWTGNVLEWSGDTQVLLGVPAYDDAGVGYHYPHVENLKNALRGLHAGLSRRSELPDHYAGVAIYCGWEMEPEEWELLEREFTNREEALIGPR